MKCIFAISALTCALTPGAFASQLYFDARNDAMGGAGVASSDFVSAAFVNPALIGQGRHDYIGVILPALPFTSDGNTKYAPTSLGIQTETSPEFLAAVDQLKTASDNYDESSSVANSLAYADALTNMDGQRMSADIGSGFALALPSRGLSIAFFGNSYTSNMLTVKVSQSDIDAIMNNSLGDDKDSAINIAGVGISDLGLALAMNWGADIAKVSIGVSPKYQRIDTYSYNIELDENGLREFENAFSDGLNKQSHFNLDAGIAVDFAETFRIAVSGRNLIEKELDLTTTAYQGMNLPTEELTFKLEPLVTAGFALHHPYATVTAEMDLNDAMGFDSNIDSRFARAGLELNVFDFIQLRAGVRHDLNDVKDDIYTLGFGISPVALVHIDVAATLSKDGAYGVYQDGKFADQGLSTQISDDENAVYGIDGFVVQVSAKF